MTVLQISWVEGADTSIGLPHYETPGAAGADLRAHLPEGATLVPGQRMLVPTGLKMAVPQGFEVQIRPRSGLALKKGIALVNSPGTIDADYRGEVGIILLNTGSETFTINHGDRVAQMVLAPVIQAQFDLVETLDSTARGAGGFGSTGVG